MIILKEFIWQTDHDAFHITTTDNMEKICKEGLLPLCGERSKSVGDNIEGIFFFDYLGSAPDWMDALYEDKDVNELELLKFNLKHRKWLKQNCNEFYLTDRVAPQEIQYLRIYDKAKKMYLPLNLVDSIEAPATLRWKHLDKYKPLAKRK